MYRCRSGIRTRPLRSAAGRQACARDRPLWIEQISPTIPNLNPGPRPNNPDLWPGREPFEPVSSSAHSFTHSSSSPLFPAKDTAYPGGEAQKFFAGLFYFFTQHLCDSVRLCSLPARPKAAVAAAKNQKVIQPDKTFPS